MKMRFLENFIAALEIMNNAHSVRQKSIGMKFSKSWTRIDVRYSYHHNSSPLSHSFTVWNKQPSTCSSWLSCLQGHLPFLLTQQTPVCLSSLFMPTVSSNSPPVCYRSILTQLYSCVLQLAAPKNALHVFLSLCTKTVSNYRVVK
jgi:hypothetical protein